MRFFSATEIFVVKWCAPLVKGWRASINVTTLALVSAFILLLTSPDFGDLANLFLVVPLASLSLIGLLIYQGRHTKVVCFALLGFYTLTTWQLQKHWMEIRSDLRWVAGSRSWKDVVLRRPTVRGSGMKWVVWDGWGMFAQDTDVYLVYSPDDQLRNYSASHLSGLPCPVWRVQRLERNWYSVTFYTEEGWNYCGASAR